MSTDTRPDAETPSNQEPPVRALVFTSPAHDLVTGRGTFSPTTATLVVGQSQSVLIDAQYMRTDIAALGDMIEATGTELTTILITHGHGDHYFGIGALLNRFPSARPLATAGVVKYIEKTRKSQIEQWRALFGDAFVEPTVLPEPMTDLLVDLESTELRMIEVGQGDIYPSTAVHIPAISAVIPGDIIYNQIHMMLGFTGPQEWSAWTESVDRIAELAPEMIVAGHKKPGASDQAVEEMLACTRAYISDFADAAQTATDAHELEATMLAKYDALGNPWTLKFSARAWFSRKQAEST